MVLVWSAALERERDEGSGRDLRKHLEQRNTAELGKPCGELSLGVSIDTCCIGLLSVDHPMPWENMKERKRNGPSPHNIATHLRTAFKLRGLGRHFRCKPSGAGVLAGGRWPPGLGLKGCSAGGGCLELSPHNLSSLSSPIASPSMKE